MPDSDFAQRLSQLETMWTVVCRACGDGSDSSADVAQKELLDRYSGVVQRYLRGALRSADAADELSQEFALQLLRGHLRGANRSRGRFRDFLKGVLFHMISDYHRRQKKQPLRLASGVELADDQELPEAAADQEFLGSWRAEMLSRAWKALEDLEQRTGKPLNTILQFRAAHPDLRSAEMAERLSLLLGKPVTAEWVRQNVHRAREKFAEFLVDEVLQTLDRPKVTDLEQELIDLQLIEYCRPVLDRLPH